MKTPDDRDFIKRQYTDDYGGNPYSKKQRSGIVLITANREAEIDCDVVLYTSTSGNLDQGIGNFAPISYSGTDGYFLWILF